MPVRIDYSKATEGFSILEPGYYRAKVADVQIKTAGPQAKNPGSQYFEFTYVLPYVGEGEMRGKRQAWNNFSLLPDQLWRFKDYLVTCHGYDPESFTDEFEFDEADVKNDELIIQLDQHEYRGKKQNGVTGFMPSDADVMLQDE